MTDPKKLIAEIQHRVAQGAGSTIEKERNLEALCKLKAWVDKAQGEIREYEKGAEI